MKVSKLTSISPSLPAFMLISLIHIKDFSISSFDLARITHGIVVDYDKLIKMLVVNYHNQVAVCGVNQILCCG